MPLSQKRAHGLVQDEIPQHPVLKRALLAPLEDRGPISSHAHPMRLHDMACARRQKSLGCFGADAALRGLPKQGDSAWAQRRPRGQRSRATPCPSIRMPSLVDAASPPLPDLARSRFTQPGRPPPKGGVRAKSTCFSESRRTRKEGMSQIYFPMRMWRWRMSTRA